jgi:hypothetical protein
MNEKTFIEDLTLEFINYGVSIKKILNTITFMQEKSQREEYLEVGEESIKTMFITLFKELVSFPSVTKV